MRSFISASVAAFVLVPSTVHAQVGEPAAGTFRATESVARTPASEVLALLRSIEAIVDTSRLDRIDARLGRRQFGRHETRLVEAVVAQRRYELGGGEVHHRAAVRLADEFDPGLAPVPAYARWLGHITLYGPETGLRTVGWYPVRPVFSPSNAEYRARRQLVAAIASDSTLVGAALDLAALAIATHRADPLKEARDALAAVAAAGAADARVHTAAALVELAFGQEEEALASAKRALRLEPDDPSALHAFARALWAQTGHDAEAANAYFAGAERMDEMAATQYFQDLLPILSAEESQEWISLSNSERHQWLREFWALEAALGGRTVSARLGDHYRRLRTANAMYRRTSGRGAPPAGSVLHRPDPRVPFDDRGVIFVRHGQPEHVIRTMHALLPRNETWAYPGPDGRSVSYTFLQREHYPDYHLSSLPGCGRSIGAGSLFYDQRTELGYPFNELAVACTAGGVSSSRYQEINADVRAVAIEGLTTRDDRPRFQRFIPLAVRTYSFRAERVGQSRMEVGLLLAGDALTGVRRDDGMHYASLIHLAVIDTLSKRVEVLDTVLGASVRSRLRDDQYLRVQLALDVPVSPSTVFRFLVRDADAPTTGAFVGGPADVRDYPSGTFGVSDIVLSDLPPADGADPPRPPLLASHAFRSGQAVHVFYDIYDLPPGARYRVRLTIRSPEREDGLWDRIKGLFGSDRSIRLTFDQVAPATPTPVLPRLRRLRADLSPGDYALTIDVENRDTDERVQRTTSLTILE